MVVRQRFRTRGIAASAVALATMVALGSCTTSSRFGAGAGDDRTAAAPAAESAGGRAGGTPTGASAPAEPSTSREPSTTEPSTTREPSTTEPPTTGSPTTTEAPTTTTPPTAPPTTPPPGPPADHVPVEPLAAPLAAVGSGSGGETARIQQRLLDLGFWVDTTDGSYGLTTRQAVMAFQKYLQVPATGEVDSATAAFMSNLTLRAHGRADAGTLVEVDKHRQLLFFIVDGKVKWVFNTSTGNGEEYIEEDKNTPGLIVEGVSLTPDGLHRVTRERAEGWWEGDLGKIYRPKYFVGGVAVHGSNSIPNYPASHGCVRVTIQAMDFIWESGLMPLTMPVWVHEFPTT